MVSSSEEEGESWTAVVSVGIALWLRSAAVLVVKLHAAHRATVMVLDPVLEAGPVEGMLAGELAAVLALLDLLEANVAVSLLRCLALFRQIGNVVSRAAS